MRQLMTSEYYADGQRLLLDWDFTQPADSARGGVLQRGVEQRPAAHLPRPAAGVAVARRQRPLDRGREQPAAPAGQPVVGRRGAPRAWWRTATRSSSEAMRDARDELTRKISVSPTKWTWGHLHRLELENQSLGQSGDRPWSRRSSTAGPYERRRRQRDAWTRRAGTRPSGTPSTSAPSMRMVVDLDDLDRSRWINLTGASGHVASGHYRDQTPLWVEGQHAALGLRPRGGRGGDRGPARPGA